MLTNQQDELSRRIAERRALIRAGREGPQAATPLRALERRKFQSPSSVIVLEVLSQILPDHTYVTELRIEGDKVRVTGVTRDAHEPAGRIEPPHCRAPRPDPRRTRGSAGRDAAARAGTAQVSKPVERDRARGALADPARPHLCHRTAH